MKACSIRYGVRVNLSAQLSSAVVCVRVCKRDRVKCARRGGDDNEAKDSVAKEIIEWQGEQHRLFVVC